jgi:hypothetical protein
MTALERAWTYQSEWAERGDEDSLCFLDLRAQIESLEKRCAAQLMQLCDLHTVQLMQLSDLQERHHRLALQTRHLESELYTDDEPQQHCVEALEDISKPTPNPSQIRSSLLDRVAAAIADTDAPADLWHDDARAALHEVAVWLQSNGHWEAADVLETMEAHR